MIPNKKTGDNYHKSTRLTDQKRKILACLRHFMPVHPTSQMIFQKVKKEISHVSLGTVYRNLNSLRETGFIEEISIHNEPSRFDSRVDAHLHFRCENCQEIFDVEDPSLFQTTQRILKKKGFLIKRSSIVYSGFCKNCQKQKKGEELNKISCPACGRIKSQLLPKSSSCQVCNFQEECLYHKT